MASTLERRNDNPERVPLRMAVELGDGDFRDPFAASVCNVEPSPRPSPMMRTTSWSSG